MMKVKLVIRMGRKRKPAASIAAATVVRPWISSSRANSTIRIAFLQARPISTKRPIWVKMLLSPPVSQTPAIADSNVIGTIRITVSGSDQLSYWAASTP